MRTRGSPGADVSSASDPVAAYRPNETRAEVIRVALVDDHPILRAGLVWAFEHHPGFEVVAEGASGAEAIQIAETLLPDLILLDINMPGDGVRAARAISRTCPAVRIIMLTAHDGEQHVVNALRCGASGYVVKGVSSEELIKTAQSVHKGEACEPACKFDPLLECAPAGGH